MKELLLRCRGVGEVHGDCTSTVYYELTRPCTVRELCEYIVSNDREWGYIGIKVPGTIFGEPRIEYSGGKFVDKDGNEIKFNFPKDIADKTVKKVHASGGWSRMDYLLEI